MIARNTLEALAQRPLSFLSSAWPWRSLAYLLSSAAIGGCAAGLGVLLYVLWDGLIPVAAAAVMVPAAAVAWAVSWYERRRLRLVMVPPPGAEPEPAAASVPPRSGSGDGLWSPDRTRDVGYGAVALLFLWWTDLGVALGSLGVPAFLLMTPFQPTATLAMGWAGVIAGLVLLPVAAYPVAAWAGVRGAMARAVLLPGDSELTQVMESRARLVDAFEVERRRIERDLHDGAQQRLVALSVKLGLAGLELPPGSFSAQQVREAQEQAQKALQELRELIHNIHPQVLTDRGLEPAVRDVAGRSPVPVDVDITLPGRLPAQVETTAYFVVSEALANIAKHSRATRGAVRGRPAGGKLVLEIRDDGVGGAATDGGTGLVGITDRLAVLGGRMYLSSPAGGPTVLRMEIPCEP